jgi:hypothetical protein
VSLGATFYQGADCTGQLGRDDFGNTLDGTGSWHELTGVLIAPAGTQSALFQLSGSSSFICSDWCGYNGAYFDDVEVDDASVTNPVIGSFTPGSGPPGATVDISGANFTAASQVTFNGVAANFTVDSDTEIHATVPEAATTGPISVTTTSGTGTSPLPFTVTSPPTISTLAPTSGPVGTSVDIQGSSFTGATNVTFNGTAAAYTVDSDSEIHASVPSSATSGPVSVTTPSGTTTTTTASVFTVTHPPTITYCNPTSGPVGTIVDLQGTNLSATTSVTFNGTAAAYTVNSDSEIHATVPNGATTGPLAVTTPDGTITSVGPFTVTLPPTISSFTPTSAPVGATVSITGNNFTGATSVKFNGSAASYTVNSATSVTTAVPTGATSGPISVTTAAGTATSAGSFNVIPAPTIASFTPTQGPVGKKVTIYGSNFVAVSTVNLGTIAAAFTLNSPTQITATVPNIAHGSYKWSVTNPAGTAKSATYFHVTQTSGQMHVTRAGPAVPRARHLSTSRPVTTTRR